MSELYWLNVLGNLNGFCKLLMVLSIIAFVVCVIFYFVSQDEDLYSQTSKSIAKFIRFTLLPILIISTIGNTFIPDTKTLYVIYGVGCTLDYLKENKTAKHIPDKAILALDKYLNEQLGDNDNKGDK